MGKILPCKCHKVTSKGTVFSKLTQFSEKGHQGIITKIGKWRSLSPSKTVKGYLQISLHGRAVRLNRLVALNFISNPLAYPEVQHKDGDKKNNTVENLKWGNQKHNAEDRKRHGNSIHGTQSKNAKLNSVKVKEIRERRATTTLQNLANKYNVSKKLILLVVQGKIWRHVK